MSVDILAPEDEGTTTIAHLRHWNALYKEEARRMQARLDHLQESNRTLLRDLLDAKATIRYLEDPANDAMTARRLAGQAREDEVYACRQAGMTFRAIAHRFGFAATRASQIYYRAERRHQREGAQAGESD
jgi:hypothetical protein